MPTMTTQVMRDTRPWCIGYFALDLPRNVAVENQEAKYMMYTIKTAAGVSRSEFADKVDAREHELKTALRTDLSSLQNATTKNPWLHQAVRPSENSRLLIFRDADSASVANLPYDVEGYAWSAETQFSLKTNFGVNYDQKNMQVASEILRNIRPRGDWDVPQDGAFCFNGGAIGGKPMPGFDATLAARLVPGRPSNLVVQLRESVDVDKDASLLKDLEQLKEQLKPYAGHYTILRTGKRQFGGMQAEEMLVDIHADGVQKYEFYLLAPGVDGDLSKPHAAIQLLFGGEPDNDTSASIATSPVDKEQALQAWDTVLGSFHYRGASK